MRNYKDTPSVGGTKLTYLSANGITVVVPGRLVELSEDGCCLELDQPIETGILATLTGQLGQMGSHRVRGRITWCRLRSLKSHRAGMQFLEPVQVLASDPHQQSGGAKGGRANGAAAADSTALPDYYEILQLARNADLDTVHRVYRMLAQRYHPDNTESGNAERFRQVLEAYRVLSDPEQRAAYDATHLDVQRVRWRIFDQNTAIDEFDAERAKRSGVLALLYRKRVTSPRDPGMAMQEIEDLLAVPREHLEFTFWYLKENNWVVRSDNNRYSITIAGVDHLEKAGVPRMNPNKLITGKTEAAA
ncbi:MAG: J domain-containing protein [Bryobacterales bacterium]|nr:J domain-containing protein [Bryobacterales bacterium]